MKMIKVLLADDNKISLDYFASIVDWKAYGFELVSAAVDGEEAFRDFKRLMPEVVITDIKMPQMDGIALTKKIYAIAPETIVIFLSSYSEFTYARSALKLKVFDYLLKHETKKSVLLEKLSAIKNQLQYKSRQNRYLLERELHSMLLADSQASPGDMTLYHPVFSGRYDLFVVKQDHTLPVISEKLHVGTEPTPSDMVKKACYDGIRNAVAMEKMEDHLYVLLQQSEERALDCAYETQKALSQQLEQSFSVIIVCENQPIEKVAQSFRQIRRFVPNHYFFPPSTVLNDVLLYVENSHPGRMQTELFRKGILNDRTEEIYRMIDQYYMSAMVFKDYQLFSELTGLLIDNLLTHHAKTIDYETGILYNVFGTKGEEMWRDAFSVFQWVKQEYAFLSKITMKQKEKHCSDMVYEIISYINRHYWDSELNVEQIASALNVSVSKLHAVFRKETGNTVWKTIVQIRMHHAKKLMDEETYTATEICSMVGYNSLSYFSRVFKKEFGVSPQEYRRNL